MNILDPQTLRLDYGFIGRIQELKDTAMRERWSDSKIGKKFTRLVEKYEDENKHLNAS